MIPTPAKRARWREVLTQGAFVGEKHMILRTGSAESAFLLECLNTIDKLEARLRATVEAGMMFHSKDCVATGVALSMREPCDCGATRHNEKVRQAAQGGKS